MIKRFTIIMLIIMLGNFTFGVHAHQRPDDVSFTDFSGIISDGVKNYVKSKNDALYSYCGARIIFVTSDTTDGMDINEYAGLLYQNWNIASIGRENSVFVVIDSTKNDYALIQSDGIKGALTDTKLYTIVSESFEPEFAKTNYDKAVMSLYNALGMWYEKTYYGMDLNLDDNYISYITIEKTKDTDKEPSKLWLWCAAAGLAVFAIVFFKIKRKVDFKLRQHERRIIRKRSKADLDKIVNS